MQSILIKNFKNKKVLITGHTGFKGSWLTMWLNILGARVAGISNNFPSFPNHYKLLNLNKKILSKNLVNLINSNPVSAALFFQKNVRCIL